MDGSSDSSRYSSGFRGGYVDLDNYRLIKVSYPVERHYEGDPKFCYCNMMAPRWTSWTDDNPGRRFYGCPKYKDKPNSCKYWDWHDPSLSDRGKEILLELKGREKLLLNEARFWKRQAQIMKNNAVDVVQGDLIEENARLKNELKLLKGESKSLFG